MTRPWRIRFPELSDALREREEGRNSAGIKDRFEALVRKSVADRMDAPRDVRDLYIERVLAASEAGKFHGFPEEVARSYPRENLAEIEKDVRELVTARGLISDRTETLAHFWRYDGLRSGDFMAHAIGLEAPLSDGQAHMATLLGRRDLDGRAHDFAVVYPRSLEGPGEHHDFAVAPVSLATAKLLVAEAGEWRNGVDVAYDGSIVTRDADAGLERLARGLDLQRIVCDHDPSFERWDAYTAAAREVVQKRATWAPDAMERVAEVVSSRSREGGELVTGTVVGRDADAIFVLTDRDGEQERRFLALPDTLRDERGGLRKEPRMGERAAFAFYNSGRSVEVRDLPDRDRTLSLNPARDLQHTLESLGIDRGLEATET